VAIPFGIGYKYRLDRRWDIGAEIGIRKLFTDYIDDISTNYAAREDLLRNPKSGMAAAVLADRSGLASPPGIPGLNVRTEVVDGVAFPHMNGWGRRGDQRGDPSDNDWFFTVGVQASYILRPNIRSPKFR
jgi:hypothetical protein